MSNIKPDNRPDNRTEKRKIGDYGEEVACMFLMKRGYKVVDRNYLKKYGEIDIVAVKDGVFHFIEVKTVTVSGETGSDAYKPEDNVHPWKLKRLSRAIQTYIAEKRLGDKELMIDIVSVRLNMHTRLANVHVLENVIV